MSITTRQPTDELVIAPEDRARLWHIFPPYSLRGESAPIGAKALCGAIRMTTVPPRFLHDGDPDSCIVCDQIFLAMRRDGRLP